MFKFYLKLRACALWIPGCFCWLLVYCVGWPVPLPACFDLWSWFYML